MIVDIDPAIIRTFLQEGGMPKALSEACVVETVPEGALAITFKISLPDGVFYLKFSDAEGAKGGVALKHLLPINDKVMREHAEKRRQFVRKALDAVITERATIVPGPCYFDLKSIPMTKQKSRAQKEKIFAELRVDDHSYPARIASMVAALWKELPIKHLPMRSPDKLDVWDPTEYTPDDVFLCTGTLGELEEKTSRFIQAKIKQKIEKGKGSFEEIDAKLRNKLRHEQRNLAGYDILLKDFLSSLGLCPNDREHLQERLREQGRNLLQRIEETLKNFEAASLAELQTKFLQDLPIDAKYANLPFQKLLFTAERERWWSHEIRLKGKRLDQLQQAKTIAKSLIETPERIEMLIQDIFQFQAPYAELETLPQALVPQDGHPFNIFLNLSDGKTSMLDLEDVSMAARISDLSNVYIFKIIRGLIFEKITEPEAIQLIKASLDGYNASASSPLSEQELRLMADYSKGACLNFLSQFGIILRMNLHELDNYNLAMSLDTFLDAFNLRNQISQKWPHLLQQAHIK
jgi:hypothetical protein